MVKFLRSASVASAVLLLAACASSPDTKTVYIRDKQYAPPTTLYESHNLQSQTLIPVGPNVPTGLEREALNRFIRELKLLHVLIDDARTNQNPEKRIKFNYLWIKNDLDKIKKGVLEYMHAPSTTPRDVEPLSGDYRQ